MYIKNQQNGGPGVRRGKEEAPVQKVWEVMELEEEIQREAAFFLHAYGVGSLSLSLSLQKMEGWQPEEEDDMIHHASI